MSTERENRYAAWLLMLTSPMTSVMMPCEFHTVALPVGLLDSIRLDLAARAQEKGQ